MTRTGRCLCLALLMVSSAFAQNLTAQDDEDELPSGLLAEYSTPSHAVRRVDPDIAFVWNQYAPDERLAAGPFSAKWSGRILLRGEGKTRWHAFVQGKVEVRIDDKIIVRGEANKPGWVSGDEFDFGFGEKPLAVTFTRTGEAAQLKLFWSSNDFPLEPLPYHILFHEAAPPEIALAARGRVVFEAHRCANCHSGVEGRGLKVEGQTKTTNAASSADSQPSTLDHQPALRAPSLKHVGQGTSRAWLVEKVMGTHTTVGEKTAEKAEEKPPNPLPTTDPAIPEPRRGGKAGDKAEGKMPHFGFSKAEAEAVVAALIEQALSVTFDAPSKLKDSERDKDLKEGRTLIRSVGCLACHTQDKLGEATPFGGGSLTDIGQRRSADWLATWLAKPSQLNEHARMPVVSLSDKERAQIVLALLVSSSSGQRGEGTGAAKAKSKKEEPLTLALSPQSRGEGTGKEKAIEDPVQAKLGWKLIESSRCSACHEFSRPQSLSARPRSLARGDVDWMKSCTQATNRQPSQPSFSQVDEKAIRAYVASWRPAVQRNEQDGNRDPLPLNPQPSTLNPARLLEQKNCLACHDRDESKGLSRLAAAIAKADETLNGLHMTLIPPRLHAVGDRLHDEALAEAIQGGPKNPRLSWLRVRMPRFQHSEAEKSALVAYLIGHDRVPGGVEGGGLRVEGQTKAADSRSSSGSQPSTLDPQLAAQRLLAGRELLGGKGFSCVACHAVKDYTPKVTALGTRGSNLHLIGQRMRPEYYSRWTRAPLRIMPGVEMPNYQRPHPTILVNADGTNSLHNQLTAIWEALNDPKLTAPTNPAVVEQLLTVNKGEQARIVRDVFTVTGSAENTVARPFAFGLDNGHSALFDLDTGSLRAWTLGDFARQRCEGKRWYWDLAGVALATGFDKRSELLFLDNKSDDVISPENGWQYETHFTQFVSSHEGYFTYDLTVRKGDQKHLLSVREDFHPDPNRQSLGWARTIGIHPRSSTGELTITPWHRGAVPESLHSTAAIMFEGQEKTQPKELPTTARPFERHQPQAPFEGQPAYFQLSIHYATTLERVEATSPNPPAPPLVSASDRVTSVPGFRGERLPLPRSIMPTAMTFDDQSRLIFTSLKGHVYRVESNDAEHVSQKESGEPGGVSPRTLLKGKAVRGLTPPGSPMNHETEGTKSKAAIKSVKLTTLTEGLAAPYGVLWQSKAPSGKHPGQPSLIVAHKPELLTLILKDDGRVAEREVLATGWGITDDYHDWTCGIVQDSEGNLLIGLGSDYAFKNRPKENSRWRGDILRIDPRGKTESIARGLRYPTGLAIDDRDRLFVTDQQGVQNTFNELNLIQTGHRYGVPSRHEPEPDAPADPPAVQLPHPWTRSVNGLVFVPRRLGTPARPASEGEERTGKSAHPTEEAWPLNSLASHFLAVEYNNNSIIRMSIQDVGGATQGAVYPFSRPTSANEAPPSATPNSGGKPQSQDSSSFIGPICIGISPAGDIYVGGFQDGGWAGGLNMGDIVKLSPDAALPNGLREIRATSRGFDLEFFHPVDPELARQTNLFKISGYTRVWKGDYATPDSGRHTGEVTNATLDEAARTVSLTVKGLKPGHVYDVSVGEIGRPDQRTLWPAIGHYTLHRVPE